MDSFPGDTTLTVSLQSQGLFIFSSVELMNDEGQTSATVSIKGFDQVTGGNLLGSETFRPTNNDPFDSFSATNGGLLNKQIARLEIDLEFSDDADELVDNIVVNAVGSSGGGGDVIPEPSTYLLSLLGLGYLLLYTRRC